MESKTVFLLRGAALTTSLVAGFVALVLLLQVGSVDGVDAVDYVRSFLIFVSTWWLAWGAVQGLIGLTTRAKAPEKEHSGPSTGRTVILMPVYNEDPTASFTRLAAMDASLRACGSSSFHFAILSDTNNEDIARQEETLFARLVAETDGIGRFFYRRRDNNKGKKAGNVEDFIVRSGAAYDYAVILDADSLMEGETILRMVARMEAEPKLGLLQTLPKIIRARSMFGRAMQFSASFYSPVFCRGLAMMQGNTGPFWGHNAIVRVRAFAESCGLPLLRGQPPFGGHIMSHDYVEAALLARAGWIVRVDDDLEGSFEEGPENIVDHAKRDRRWCQGNLQHGRLVAAPKLRLWSRFVFIQGIMAYLAPLFWLAFIGASILAPAFHGTPNYFPESSWPNPYLPSSKTVETVSLFVGVFGLLLLPKLLIVVKAVLTQRSRGFGGSARLVASMMWELLLSSLIAPILLLFTTRSVCQVLLGRDGGWPTNNRGDGRLTLSESYQASWWIVLIGLAGLATTLFMASDLFFWLLPIGVPMVLAPVLLWWTARPSSRTLCQCPSERTAPAVTQLHDRFMDDWSIEPIGSLKEA